MEQFTVQWAEHQGHKHAKLDCQISPEGILLSNDADPSTSRTFTSPEEAATYLAEQFREAYEQQSSGS